MDSDKERENLEAELRILHSKLQSDNSDIGDWKIVKAYEYQLIGEEIPYDIVALNQERQKVRDRINEIKQLLNELD